MGPVIIPANRNPLIRGNLAAVKYCPICPDVLYFRKILPLELDLQPDLEPLLQGTHPFFNRCNVSLNQGCPMLRRQIVGVQSPGRVFAQGSQEPVVLSSVLKYGKDRLTIRARSIAPYPTAPKPPATPTIIPSTAVMVCSSEIKSVKAELFEEIWLSVHILRFTS
jgi:hypothetical protein